MSSSCKNKTFLQDGMTANPEISSLLVYLYIVNGCIFVLLLKESDISTRWDDNQSRDL